jgi:hypothetical protein
MKAQAPDGRTWKVGRRWFPRRRRLGRADVSDAMPDFVSFDGGLDDLGVVGTIIAAILLVILPVLEWPVVGWRASSRKISEVAEQLRSGAQLDAARQHR